MNSRIYILLPVHNRRAITEKFVDCLLNQTYSNYHLILIDDGSIDLTAEMVKEYIPEVTVLRGVGNWWWAGGLQKGLEWLKKQNMDDDAIILFINDDVSFASDYLERAVQVMSENKGSLVLSRHRSPKNGEVFETGVTADFKKLTFVISSQPELINCLSTMGLFIHWSDVLEIGDFHPKILPHYLSDYEFTIRAHRKGFGCKSSDKLLIEPNFETTGYHDISYMPLGVFVKKYFSIKFSGNPIYWTSFVFLTAKPSLIVLNLLRIWLRACKTIFKVFVSSIMLHMHK